MLTKHTESRFPLEIAYSAIDEKKAQIKLDISKAQSELRYDPRSPPLAYDLLKGAFTYFIGV